MIFSNFSNFSTDTKWELHPQHLKLSLEHIKQTQYSSHRNHECLWLWSFIKPPNSWNVEPFWEDSPIQNYQNRLGLMNSISPTTDFSLQNPSQFFSIFHTVDPVFPPWRAVATSMTFSGNSVGPSTQFHLSTWNLKLTWHSCWWFRNPAGKPVEVGSLSHYFLYTSQVGGNRISEPSTVAPEYMDGREFFSICRFLGSNPGKEFPSSEGFKNSKPLEKEQDLFIPRTPVISCVCVCATEFVEKLCYRKMMVLLHYVYY